MAEKDRYDACVLGFDPAECTIRERCCHWSRESQSCTYAAVRELRERQREDAVERLGPGL